MRSIPQKERYYYRKQENCFISVCCHF